MTTRRTILRGLAALPVAALPAIIPDRVMAAPLDPVFAAIEKHKAAWLAFERANAKVACFVSAPEHLEQAESIASDAEVEARYDMHQVVPQTLGGLIAYVAYWNAFCEVPPGCRFSHLQDIGWEAIPTIAEAMAALFPIGGAA